MNDSYPNQGVMLYDGDCAFCKMGVRTIKKLDWRRKVAFHNARNMTGIPDNSASLNQDAMLDEMHLLTPDRQQAHAGYDAFRWMAWRLPLTMVIAPFLYIPGIPWLGNRMYRLVAKNRFRIVPCGDNGCKIDLSKKKPVA